ncbi:MAG TPA: LysM domain-containing protein, partial [Myxococcota bacterium]|nr:LysM domain-containing protein [Myxococcota bacterium]
ERYRFIMTANNITDINDLEVGRELLMPFVVKHTVVANESLSSISKLYFHSTKQVKVIQEYNGLPTSAAALGVKLLIPIVDKDTLDVRKKSPMPRGAAATATADETPPEEAKSKDPPLAAMPSDEPGDKSPGARIRRAVKQYHAGDFDQACRDLERLLGEPRLARDDRLRVIEYCGYCAVAYGDMGPARDYFRRWLEMRPDVQLDPVFTSPKIRTAVEEARKDIQRARGPEQPPPVTGDHD